MTTNGKPLISKSGSGLPSRLLLHGTEGIGKSSFAAHAPKPVFAMTRGETGLLTLIDNGQIKETDHFPEVVSWNDLLQHILYLTMEDTGHRSFVLDTLNGAERLCFEHVAAMQYGGNMESFLNFGRGPEVAQQEWVKFLSFLDRLREVRRMAIICLCHTKVKTFKNPEGDDYDRYTPDMHEKTWGLSAKWADVILFGNFQTFAKKDKGALKAKGLSSGKRFFYTRRTAAYDAKNRLGLPEEIPMGESSLEGWNNFIGAVKKAKAEGMALQNPPPAPVPTPVSPSESVPTVATVS